MIANSLADREGRFLSVDDAFCDIVGRERADLIGRLLLDITHPDDRHQNERDLDELLLNGRSFSIRKRYVLPSGEPIWVENQVASFRDGCGPVQIIGHTVLTAPCPYVSEQRRLEKLTGNALDGWAFLLQDPLGRINDRRSAPLAFGTPLSG